MIGFQAIKQVTFDPLNITDVGFDGFYCSLTDTPSGAHVPAHILPSRSIHCVSRCYCLLQLHPKRCPRTRYIERDRMYKLM